MSARGALGRDLTQARHLIRRYPTTSLVTAITLAVSVIALVQPTLIRLLEQDPQQLGTGQWWRLLTPMLVQGYGVGQLLFNVLGIAVVGIAFERRCPPWRWLVVYIGGGVLAIALTSLWFPERTDSGASAAVAALIGAVAVGMAGTAKAPPWPSLLYGVFFAVYLSALAVGGAVIAAVAGSLVIPLFALTRRIGGERLLRTAAGALIVVGTVVLLAARDAHGVGLAAGALAGALLQGRVPRSRLVGTVPLLVVLAAAVGILVLLGVASLDPHPAIFLVSGALGFLLAVGLGLRALLTRACMTARDRRYAWLLAGVLSVAMVTAFSATALVPSREHGDPAPHVAGEQYWPMPSGDVIRVVEVPARTAARPTPVIFVHGGPGTPDMRGDAEYFGQLAEVGFDVYLYDGVGAGRSTRLTDPADYSRERDVADLEAIRDRIGAPQVILIGHSYGATVVAQYLARYPDRVSRAIVSSPASLDPADRSAGEITSRLDAGALAMLRSRLLSPRNLLAYGLLQVNAAAAHALAGDAEMDAENDAVYAITEPALHCTDGEGTSPESVPTGLGFYRLQYPQSATAPGMIDIRPDLEGLETPVLVIKGNCDYLSWTAALTYTDSLRQATLVYLHGGHNTYQDAAADYLAAVLAFVNGEPVPFEVAPTRSAPADYEGPG